MTAPGDRSGTELGPYRLVRRIGRGGMGEVYEAVDTRKDRTVALKLLPENLAHDDDFRTRFLNESQTVAKLNDPHVIPIHDFGEIDGQLFLDMRIVDGQDLRSLIEQGALTPEQAVDVVGQIAGALDTAHEAGLTHRDVKPENILIDRKGFAYLVDFGLVQSAGQAGLTSTGLAIGSFNYMAPERFGTGAPIGPATDVYALGCVLYEALTGSRPFGSASMEQIIAGHLHRALPPTGTAYDEVIARATAKDPAQRYRTAGELAAAAAAAPQERSATAVAPAGMYDQHQSTQHPAAAYPPAQYPPTQYPPTQYPPAQYPGDQYPATQYAQSRPHPVGAGAPAPGKSMIALIAAAAAIVVLLAVIGGVVYWQTSGDDSTAQQPAITTVTQNPAPASEAAEAGISGTPPSRAESSGASVPPAAASTPSAPTRGPGDLGLSTPISSPPCDGRTVAFVYNATTPGAYAQEVAAALAQHPGSSYLRTDQSCQSLRQSLDGNPIYAVYYEGADLAQTCATRNRIGGETYARRLDDTTPVGLEIC